ncbi:hypothetical protein, partial [[Clostridium] symbiosum]|uniref:hypothetical protein n=1 Tax=Clostridium symbiosum TaxID=1512 RepID=UPI001D091D6D
VAGLPDLVNQALLYVGYRFLRHQDSALVSVSSRVVGVSAAISLLPFPPFPLLPLSFSFRNLWMLPTGWLPLFLCRPRHMV